MSHDSGSDAPQNNLPSKPNASAALVRTDKQAPTQSVRFIWGRYKSFHPAARIAIPSVFAIGALGWGWDMLDQGEYGVAIGLVLLFVAFGLLALREITSLKALRLGLGILIVIVGLYSTAVILVKKGDKPWTSLWQQRKSADQPLVPTQDTESKQSATVPSASPLLSPSPTPSPSPSAAKSRSKRPNTSPRIPCSAEDRLLGKC